MHYGTKHDVYNLVNKMTVLHGTNISKCAIMRVGEQFLAPTATAEN